MTVGELVAFNAYLAQLAWPMIAFGWVTNLLERGMASWKRMLTVMDTVPAVRDEEGSGIGASRDRADHGRHRVPEPELSLWQSRGADVTCRSPIEAGETVAIVGGTGSGKSTLVNLLPRLHNPPRGTVFIDGRDVRDIPLAELRGAIGFVPQEPFLFSDTLGRQRRVRRGAAGEAAVERIVAGSRHCAAGQRRARLSEWLRHHGRRAGHHAVGRPETARGDRKSRRDRSAHSDPGRCPVGRRHVHRGRNSERG